MASADSKNFRRQAFSRASSSSSSRVYCKNTEIRIWQLTISFRVCLARGNFRVALPSAARVSPLFKSHQITLLKDCETPDSLFGIRTANRLPGNPIKAAASDPSHN